MKSKRIKLSLSKETLLRLDQARLSQIQGGEESIFTIFLLTLAEPTEHTCTCPTNGSPGLTCQRQCTL
jgi:hypothetical protein